MTSAAEAAAAEAAEWGFIATLSDLLGEFAVPPPTEVAVMGFDPSDDLSRRAGEWSYELPDNTLAALARFASYWRM